MPPVIIAQNATWLGSRVSAIFSTHTTKSLIPTAFVGISKRWLVNSGTIQDPALNSVAHSSEPLPSISQPPGLSTAKQRKHQDHQAFLSGDGLGKGKRLRVARDESFLDLSQRGKYKETSAAVNEFVRASGDQPKARLYEALLLANTDCWYGSADEVAQLLQDMMHEGVALDSVTLHTALKVLAVHSDYLLRGYVLSQFRQHWISLNRDGWHYLVSGLVRERQIELALRYLEDMEERGTHIQPWLWDLIIHALCAVEEFDEALRLSEYRLETGETAISPTLWSHMLDTASRSMHYPLTLFIFRTRVQNSYLNPSIGTCTNMLSTAARNGDVRLATSVFRLLSTRSGNAIRSHHYEALLETYIAARDLSTALAVLTTAKAAGQTLSAAYSRPIFVFLCKSPSFPADARQILRELRDEGRGIPLESINVIIEADVFHGSLSAAIDLYKSMHIFSSDLRPNTETFDILFRGCEQYGQKEMVKQLAKEMSIVEKPLHAEKHEQV